MKRLALPALALALAAADARAADIDIPLYMSHQGRLLDGADAPVSGAHDLTFTLYTHVEPSKDGSYTDDSLWSETQPQVSILNGVYSVRLGSVTPLDATKLSGKLFLGVKVDGHELLPRAWLSTVPFAWNAQNANRAQKALLADKATEADHAAQADHAADSDTLGGIAPTGFLQLGAAPAAQAGNAAIKGTVTAGSFVGDGTLVTGVDAATLGGLAATGFAQISASPATQTGGLALDGTVTAAKFKGDGSSLTAVNAATFGGQPASAFLGLSGSPTAQAGSAAITGTMTAARFVGDGAQLTNVNAATLGGKPLSVFLQSGQPVTLPTGTQASPPYGCSAATTGTLFYDTSAKAFLACNGTTFDTLARMDGAAADGSSPTRAVASCKALHLAQPALPNGVYWLSLDGTATNAVPVFCDMTTDGGGWTMVFKITTGAGGDPLALWNQAAAGTPANDQMVGYLGPSKAQDQYASRLLGQWNKAFAVAEARVHLYTGGNLQKFVKFNGASSLAPSASSAQWFAQAKVTGSTWTDVTTTQTYNFFSLDGDASATRRFFIHKSYGGCPADVGWLSVQTATGPCAWDTFGSAAAPRVLYAPGTTSTTWQNTGGIALADVLAIFVR